MADFRDDLQRALGSAYRLGEELPGGAMAHVFVADNVLTNQRVVIKVLPYQLGEKGAMARFRREVETTAGLRHPHIVPVLHAEQAGELLYYIMPYAGEQTLRSLMDARHQLPLPVVQRMTSEIASALTYAHEQNIVHRDIKPENILLQDGHALVTDFGIARAIERCADNRTVTSTGLTLGTPRYMSPEQASASKRVDGRSDIYSLACVVFEMLAGEPPFVSDNARTLIAKHINEPAPSVLTARPGLPESVDFALRTGLSKAPADRFDTAREFAEALSTPSAGATIPIRVAPARRARTRRALAALTVAALAIVAWTMWPAGPALPEAPVRVAVLNFESAVPDSDLAVLGRALATDVIDVLRRAPEFVPLSHAAVRTIPPGTPLDSLRKSLAVRTFVVGLLERYGDSVRVTARIIDADSLTEKGRAPIRVQFARANVMQLRDSVVEQVGRRLLAFFGQQALAREWRTGTRSLRAWELRQRAQDLIDTASLLPRPQSGFAPQLATLARADSLLAEASAEDPSWPDPYVTRGWLRSHRTMYEGIEHAATEFQAAESLANLALRRQRENAQALELRGSIRIARWRVVPGSAAALRDSAESDLRAALRLDPDLTRAWQSLAFLLNTRRDTVGATEAEQHVYDSDPYSLERSRAMFSTAMRHLNERRPDSARVACARARALFPDDAMVRTCELTVLGWAGKGRHDLERAQHELEWHERAGPIALTANMYVVGRFWIAAILARSGMTDSALAIAQMTRARLRAAGLADVALINEAQVMTELHDVGAALTLLDSATRGDPNRRQSVAHHPWFDMLRGDPRFLRYMASDK
jgi:TolB-like protein/tRNA A-37 threonylcarbamoyl transferase component Bud32/tetratricopeptide (TPR) repeat protein